MGIYLYKLPDIGEGVVEAEITAWHVTVGQTVSEEDPIADAMTDKATIELTSPCLLYTSPSPRDRQKSRMPSSA